MTTIPEVALDETKILKLLAQAAMGRRLLPTAWIVDGRCSCSINEPEGVICKQGNKAGKHPLIQSWQIRASSDVDEIVGWHRWKPLANWGWLQDQTFTLDVDPKREGLVTLAQWEDEAGGPEPTLTQRTQSGGWHFIYRQPEGGMRTEGDMLPGIEIRALGAYIMVEPSVGLGGSWIFVDPTVAPAEPDEFMLALIARHGLDLSLGDGDGIPGSRRGKKSSAKTSSLPPTEYFVKNGFGGYSGSRNKDAYMLSWRLLRHGDSKPHMYTTTRIAGIMKACWLVTDQGDAPFTWEECLGALRSANQRRLRQDKELADEQTEMAAKLVGGGK